VWRTKRPPQPGKQNGGKSTRKGVKNIVTIPIRRRILLPEGETLVVKIMDAEQVSGQWSPQLRLDLKVLKGTYAGQRVRDWSDLSVDEESGQPYIEEGLKAWEIILAANDGDAKSAGRCDCTPGPEPQIEPYG